jgi:very-short-patch-repair endonuclease
MKIEIQTQVEIVPPPFFTLKMGAPSGYASRRLGGGMPRPNRSNPKTMHQAGELRKELMPAERKLWATLRGNQLNGINFKRQHAIGKYVVDFCSPRAKLIIELDGSQHLEQEDYDNERTKYLEGLGYKVIRFWNNQVLSDMDGVISAIIFAMDPGSHS